jgi:hypothetical protein
MGGICETIVVLVEGSVNFPPGNVVDTNSSSRGRGEHAEGERRVRSQPCTTRMEGFKDAREM